MKAIFTNVFSDMDKQIHMRNTEHHHIAQRHQSRSLQTAQRHLHPVSLISRFTFIVYLPYLRLFCFSVFYCLKIVPSLIMVFSHKAIFLEA